jgi:hypothetical protein
MDSSMTQKEAIKRRSGYAHEWLDRPSFPFGHQTSTPYVPVFDAD